MDKELIKNKVSEMDLVMGWYQNIDLGNGIQTKTRRIYGEEIDHPKSRWQEILPAVPDNLEGKSVLDIGCNAGYIAFEAKSRGAERVVGVDLKQVYIDQANFCADVKGMDIDFRVMNIYDLKKLAMQFDLVFCVGLLYHCYDILSAVRIVSEVTKHQLILETAIENIDSDLPLVRYSRWSQFSPAFKGGNGLPGHWHPNFPALEAMFSERGFKKIDKLFEKGRRGGIVAYK